MVQSVGRVMRKAPGQAVRLHHPAGRHPAGITPEEALSDNKKYKVVWQVLQALRAHDDRFNAMVNKIDLNGPGTTGIQIIGVGVTRRRRRRAGPGTAKARTGQRRLPLARGWMSGATRIYAKIVTKVGDRRYWEDWAKDIAAIAERHITRISALLADPGRT